MAYISSAVQFDPNAGNRAAARIVRLRDGRKVRLRAACRKDIAGVQQFVRGLSMRSRRNRFFSALRELSPDQLERVTRSRPPDEVALVGESTDGDGSRIVAMAQYAVCEALDAEFAIVVDDAWQRQGLGTQLLGTLAEHAAHGGLMTFGGLVLADNWPMLEFLARFDYETVTDGDPRVIRVIKRLDAPELVV